MIQYNMNWLFDFMGNIRKWWKEISRGKKYVFDNSNIDSFNCSIILCF